MYVYIRMYIILICTIYMYPIYVCIYICTYICYIYIYLCMYKYMYVYIYECIHMYHLYVYVCHIYMYIYICIVYSMAYYIVEGDPKAPYVSYMLLSTPVGARWGSGIARPSHVVWCSTIYIHMYPYLYVYVYSVYMHRHAYIRTYFSSLYGMYICIYGICIPRSPGHM